MSEAPQIPGKAASRRKAESSTPEPQSPLSSGETAQEKCQFAEFQGVIDWFNVVDDFKFIKHKNFLPRWAFVMLVLLFFAIN